MLIGSGRLNVSGTQVSSEYVLILRRGQSQAHRRHLNENLCFVLSEVLFSKRKPSKYSSTLIKIKYILVSLYPSVAQEHDPTKYMIHLHKNTIVWVGKWVKGLPTSLKT